MIKKVFRKVVAGIMAGVTAVSLMMSGGNLETAKAATSVSGVSTVSNMPSDFARGVDISAVIALEKSGATYSYLDGTQADPAKQFAPKAWADYSLAYKKDAVYNFTYDSLKELLDYGVDVGMVQIGNETNGAMAGVGGLYDNVWDLSSGVAALMQQGCYAVDDINSAYGKSMLKVLHFTDFLERGEWYAQCLAEQGVDYDVFATITK